MGTTTIDMATWARRPHFELFNAFSHPWLDICTTVDATPAWTACQRAGGPSFFAASVYLALRAANAVAPLRQRVEGDRVVEYERIHAGVTVLRGDDTFGFGFIDYDDDFAVFAAAAAAEVERVRSQSGELVDRPHHNVVHFSIVPWFSFSSVGHPRQRGARETIPKIVLGRCTEEHSRWSLPVAVSVHHGLVDALHVAHFLDHLGTACADAERLLVYQRPGTRR